ncbi:matrixin family metalloprotease [Actinomadura madurae]|uniref:matrixin family metalloprotease n=1 Tax=Actinomadura madurae TaxID=1993 RepID=UPI002025B9D9|nr:matrixin family metalloprotease [Actinomadura madurae]MCP9951500.1 M10 family metallopeptidase domain-containing protein [Actinomadura madurae]MCP9968277.1 M10 family metallopeptidase domain-containing protein [Actinomadura madurae]MCP9980739.1 M10 family metallopeptidase domain-containing protein [Actinomadura madurae]MCQ0007757.1 M10 family metallopeptidase domain-containing protein [Actinomadura madurae]MCQ0016934.1 M10 family metallopeptidase domain-containing protein [Actinomadura madu
MRDFSTAARRAGAVTAAVTAALACTAPSATATAAAAPRPPAWCKAVGALAVRTLPHTIRIDDCDLRGRTVRGNGLAAVVPTDGTSLVAQQLHTNGGSELHIRVDRRTGKITIRTRSGRVPQGRPRMARAAVAACQDGTYRPEPARWPRGHTVQWHYHAGGSGLPLAPIAKGVSNMVNARTDCVSGGRFTPQPNVHENFAGQSNRPPNLTGGAACGARDRANTFGWLAMPGAGRNVLAATCMWFSGTRMVETDMALQTQGRQWWTGGTCRPGSYSVEAVATHETGHVLGLDHVSGSQHSDLTMAPSIGACDDGAATLGKGDHAGLISLYGGR